MWGYAPDEDLSCDDMLKVKYQGIRPAPGYPSQPDHTEKNAMWELMNVKDEIDCELTESLAMLPAASVSGASPDLAVASLCHHLCPGKLPCYCLEVLSCMLTWSGPPAQLISPWQGLFCCAPCTTAFVVDLVCSTSSQLCLYARRFVSMVSIITILSRVSSLWRSP